MENPIMKITFETSDFGDEAASMNAARDGKLLDEDYHLWGAVSFQWPGQSVIKLSDDLLATARTLFVLVPKNLKEPGQVDLSTVGWPGLYSFISEADKITVTSSKGERAEFPAAEFRQELDACGLRFLSFLEEVSTSYPNFDFLIKELREGLTSKS